MKIKYEELMEGVMITKGIRKALEILGHDLIEELVEITIFLEDSKNDGKWHIFEMDTMTDTVVCTKQKNKIFMLLGDEAEGMGE